jgi:hypothetical protein
MRAILTSGFLLIALALAQPVRACWVKRPLLAVISEAKVIVVGKVVRVQRARSGLPFDYDTAVIAVQEVLKGRWSLPLDAAAPSEVRVAFPSVHNTVRRSTDIRYQRGQRGVWLLRSRGRDPRFLADCPQALQPLDKVEEIRALAGPDRSGGPAGSIDTRARIQDPRR